MSSWFTRVSQWFEQTKRRVSRRGSIGGAIVTVLSVLWAIADRASTGQSIARWWSDAQPHISAVWKIVSRVDPVWYQTALLVTGLGWIAYVASRPEAPPEVPQPVATQQKLKIHLALYGIRPNYLGIGGERDVTVVLQQRVVENRLVMPINDQVLLGETFFPGTLGPKRIRVQYSFGGDTVRDATVQEHDVLVLPESQPPSTASLAENAELRLHIYGDERQPTRISLNNIWRWYYLRNILVGIDKEMGRQIERITSTLFIVFDRPTALGTPEVTAGFQLPRYEIKDFSNRSMVIAFFDDLPAGDLTISVRQ